MKVNYTMLVYDHTQEHKSLMNFKTTDTENLFVLISYTILPPFKGFNLIQ